ncbi:MAG: tryptophan synthase subunit alpha [Phycisphaerae bacterium]
MNRLQERFDSLAAAQRKFVLPYITAGYPDVGATIELLEQLDHDHIGAVELGIPFSDPIADGPVIQTSFYRALESGYTNRKLFDALAKRRAEIAVPLIAMVSYSIVARRGCESFVEAAVAAGIDGFIVPDLSLEEASEFATICCDRKATFAMLVAPNTSTARRERIAALSTPFVYYQAVAGITGERAALPDDLVTNIESLRGSAKKPVCVGFGIAKPEQAREVCRVADGVIVGSAIVRRMNESVERGDSEGRMIDGVTRFVNELADAVGMG